MNRRPKEPFFSIVIPVYNAEKYLGKCLESIINQTFSDIEIILINDNSADESLELCNNFAEKDSRITVLNNSVNKGPQLSRMKGINSSRGKYVSFVDADDWVELDLYEKLYNEINDDDIVIFGKYLDYISSSEKIDLLIAQGEYKTRDEIDYILTNMMYCDKHKAGIISANSVDKIYRRDLICNLLNEYNYNLKYAEDQLIVYMYMLRCKVIKISDFYGYHYRQAEGSSMRQVDVRYLRDIGTVYELLYNEFKKHELADVLINGLQKKLINDFLGTPFYKVMGISEDLIPVKYQLPNYDFEDKNIILYGAGDVGMDYHRQLLKQNCKSIIWVDSNYSKIREKGYDVQPVDAIKENEFDVILVAVLRQSLYLNIKESLVAMGVEENYILWR